MAAISPSSLRSIKSYVAYRKRANRLEIKLKLIASVYLRNEV